MKKIFNTAVLVFLLFLGANVVQAQSLAISNDRPEDIAKAKVSLMRDHLDLSGDQQRALFRAYVKKEVGVKKYITGEDFNSPTVQQQKTKLNIDLEEAVEKELTAEQFSKWKKEFKDK